MDFFMKDQQDGVSPETNLQAMNFHGDGDCNNVELKEQDLIKQLDEKESRNSGESGSVEDCTLTLGPSGRTLRQMDHSNHARNDEPLYVPINCGIRSSQITTGMGSSSRSGYSRCMMPMDFRVIPKFAMKNMQESGFFQSKANVGDGRKEEITTMKKCCFCETTSTPLWRNGPSGSKSLCNACGIRYKKEIRKALAAATAATVDCTLDIHGRRQQDNHAQQSKRST